MITSAKYNANRSICAVINGDEMTIPDDLENRHRQMIAEWEAAGNVIQPYVEPEPEQHVTIIPAVMLWERMTETEAEQVSEAMASQPFRTRKIFETAATFRSDHELWPLLELMSIGLFGPDRAAKLLAA